MPQIDKYTAGTVTLTNGSATVTGNATNWISGGLYSVVAGHWFRYGSFTSLIVSVNSATSITLAEPYPGSTASGLSYEVYRYTRLETPEAVGFLQSLLARGSATNPFTRVDLDSGSVRASFRDDGTGQLGWYVGTTGAADGSQVKSVTLNKSNGHLGVGGAPSYRLDVQDTGVPFRILSSGQDAVARFECTGTGGRIYHVGSTGSSSGAGNGFGVYDVTGLALRMIIAPGGNVGIGTGSPGAKLTAAGAGFNGGAGIFRSTDSANGVVIEGVNGALINDTAFIELKDGSGSTFIGRSGTNVGAGDFRVIHGGAEQIRIGGSGSVGIGTTAPVAKVHVNAFDLGTGLALLVNGATKGIRFNFDSTTSYIEGVDNTGVATFQPLTLQGSVINIGNGSLRPLLDNYATNGDPSHRWTTVYAATGTINTSDAREKTAIRPLNPAELRAAQRLAMEIGVYQWLEAVKEKGDAARQHIGMTVQRAIEIMEEEGLDPWAYGFMCRDEITRKVKVMQKRTVQKVEEVEVSYVEIEVRDGVPVQVTKTRTDKRPVMQSVPVLDEAGKPVLQEVQATEEQTETYTEIEMRDGKPVQVEKKRTVKVPVFETVQVVNAKGKPVTEKVLPEGLAFGQKEKRPVTTQVPVMTTEPVMHSVPVMVEEEVEVEIDEPAGDRLGFRPDQIDRFIMRGLAEKIALLEGK